MAAKLARDGAQRGGVVDGLRGWAMLALTFGFLLFYAAALAGLIRPPDNDRLVWRLEPLIFVIVGYFFGRLPSQQNERTLKEEINRQTQRADAAQHAREQVQQSREALEEKVKNARSIIAPAALAPPSRALTDRATTPHAGEDTLRAAVAAAMTVLNS